MKRAFPIFALLLVIASCKKEDPTGGGLRVAFTPRHQYLYQSINVFVSSSYYDGILNQASGTDVSRPILLQPVREGNWYWRCIVNYKTPAGDSGNKDFEGTIVIKKGIIENITIED